MASAATSPVRERSRSSSRPGTDPNVAVLNVNNRIATVKNRLPPIVERRGNHRHAVYDEHADVCECF